MKLKHFVIYSLAMVTLFTIAVFIACCCDRVISDTLITCFFSVFGGECLFACLIKIFKLRKPDETFNDNSI